MQHKHMLTLAAAVLALASCSTVADKEEAAKDKPPPDPDYEVLRVGFAKTDITPGRQHSLGGYGFRKELPEGNTGVHDPIYVRALAIRHYRRVAVLVSLDLGGMGSELAREYRGQIARKLSTPTNNVIISCTHSHSAPTLLTPELAKKWEIEYDTNSPPVSMKYTEELPTKIMETVRRAESLTYPVTVWVREAPFALAYNRRAKTDRGLKNCWEPQQFPNRQPVVPADITCSVLMFDQAGGPRRYLLWSIGAHPTVLGQTSRIVSADYPGVACSLIDQYVPGARSMFVLGAAGDTQPWIATQEDPAQLLPVARAAASYVALLSQAGRPVPVKPPFFKCAGETVKLGEEELDITVWKIGSVWIVATPGEMFSSLSAKLRKKLKGEVILATLSNGYGGYLPAKSDYADGGYEVETAKRQKIEAGAGEKLIDRIIALAKTLE
ncbi:neutral/alkaline non-lysosomal ceramidase N-terminal domain-containing protein [Verrucomicrobiota bacterium]